MSTGHADLSECPGPDRCHPSRVGVQRTAAGFLDPLRCRKPSADEGAAPNSFVKEAGSPLACGNNWVGGTDRDETNSGGIDRVGPPWRAEQFEDEGAVQGIRTARIGYARLAKSPA